MHTTSHRFAVTILLLALAFCGDPGSPPRPPVDAPPEAAFTARCSEKTCSFTDGSSDPDGTIMTRKWDFGDGATATEVNPAHTYAQDGNYLVRLTVADDSGATASSSETIVIETPPPPPPPPAELVLIGAGDIAGCSSGNDEATAAIIAKYPAAVVYTLGDNAYPDGTASNYSQCYEPSWGQFKDRTRAAPGNHDYHTTGAAGYFGYYGASAGPAGRGYYSYDVGSWHIISLDSEIGVGATSAQATWLKQDLADHPAGCTLAYWHQPLFTSGAPHAPATAMRPLFTLLYDAGADIVLSGHNHQYERFAPQRPDGTRDDAAGIREFVAGTGGAGLYDFTTPQPNSEVRSKTFGVLKLTLGATNYSWEFVPVAGSSFTDSGTGDCH